MLNANLFSPVTLKYFNGIIFQLERCPVTSLHTQDVFRATKKLLISAILQPSLSYESTVTFFVTLSDLPFHIKRERR